MSQTEKRLTLQGREFILLGTAHISHESIVQVTTSIRDEAPDCVAIELDEQRYASMKNPEAWKNLDIVKVLKGGQGFVLMANLVLASFQKRMGADVGVKPGEDMKAAITVAEEMNVPAVMVDRPIQMTLKRAWAKNSLWGKCKLLAVLLSSAFEKSEISAEEIERLKNESEMDSMMNEIAEYLPAVKEVLIDERDRYLASRIWDAKVNGEAAKKIVAVLGAGHLPGVVRHLEALAAGTVSSDTDNWGGVLGLIKSSETITNCFNLNTEAGTTEFAHGLYNSVTAPINPADPATHGSSVITNCANLDTVDAIFTAMDTVNAGVFEKADGIIKVVIAQ